MWPRDSPHFIYPLPLLRESRISWDSSKIVLPRIRPISGAMLKTAWGSQSDGSHRAATELEPNIWMGLTIQHSGSPDDLHFRFGPSFLRYPARIASQFNPKSSILNARISSLATLTAFSAAAVWVPGINLLGAIPIVTLKFSIPDWPSRLHSNIWIGNLQ
jgi:hypothetical protein